jgi:hypothetical protein
MDLQSHGKNVDAKNWGNVWPILYSITFIASQIFIFYMISPLCQMPKLSFNYSIKVRVYGYAIRIMSGYGSYVTPLDPESGDTK